LKETGTECHFEIGASSSNLANVISGGEHVGKPGTSSPRLPISPPNSLPCGTWPISRSQPWPSGVRESVLHRAAVPAPTRSHARPQDRL